MTRLNATPPLLTRLKKICPEDSGYADLGREAAAEIEKQMKYAGALKAASLAVRDWIGQQPVIDEYEIPDSIWLPFLAALSENQLRDLPKASDELCNGASPQATVATPPEADAPDKSLPAISSAVLVCRERDAACPTPTECRAIGCTYRGPTV